MKRILVVRAMVLGAIACSISAIGFAASVESIHMQEKHEAVQSNWMDRTDIKVGTQSKVGTQISVETLQPLTHYDENSKSVLFVQGGIGRGGQEHSVSYYHTKKQTTENYESQSDENSADFSGDYLNDDASYHGKSSFSPVAKAVLIGGLVIIGLGILLFVIAEVVSRAEKRKEKESKNDSKNENKDNDIDEE